MEEQAKFEGWAVVEIMGHQRYAGFVTTQAFGGAVLFRVDVPALPERERLTEYDDYFDGKYVPKGAAVKELEKPAYTKLFGAASVYCITPCTEEAAMKALESMQSRALKLLALPEKPALDAPDNDDPQQDDDLGFS